MRIRGFVVALILLAAGTTALAQRRGGGGASATPDAGATGSGNAGGGDEGGSWSSMTGGVVSHTDAGAHPAAADTGAATTARASAIDASTGRTSGGRGAANASDAGAGTVASGTPNTFNLPMTQRGSGAIIHFPIPEQLARTEVPIFAQVRTTAPIDHVSMFYRGSGGERYREARMQPMGQNLGLPQGYGAQVPCEDAFPPAVEYYVSVFDTSGASIGTAGTALSPISLPIVIARTHPIVPTLPGSPPPRNCGSLVASGGTGGTGGFTRGTSRVDAGVASAPEFGTADLGEPCQANNDCRRGLRCAPSTHSCVFVNTN